MFSWSIRKRLTVWYTLALILVLFLSGAFWYLHLSRSLLEHTDSRLRLIAGQLGELELESLLTGEGPDHEHQPGADLNLIFHTHTRGEYIQVLDGSGNICCHSENLLDLHLPLGKEALVKSRQGLSLMETIDFHTGIPLRLLSQPVMKGDKVIALVQVAADLTPDREILRHLLTFLLIFSPLACLALASGGWVLAKKALDPFDRIIRQVNEIDAASLGQRLPEIKTHDEIGRLTETFNSMLERLQDSFLRVRQFTGDASHELRTPLAILQGETEVSLRWAKNSEEYRQTLESNLEEITRMSRIIEDLLTLSREEAGTAPLVLETFSLADLLQDLYLQGRTLGTKKNIDIHLHLQVSEDPQIRGDRWRLHQMLLNLVSNGVKYTPENGRVDISLSLEGECAIVAVKDSGIGIAQEHLPHIFDRFYRTDEARNRTEGGTGLGLAIAQLLIQAHGGRIEVESEVGKGSTFTAYLPISGPSEETEAL